MVLSPLDALSLAANILTVVDYSWTIVSGSITIYQSLDGASKETSALESVTSKLKTLCEPLLVTPLSTTRSSKAQDELRALAAECNAVAEELIRLLQSLKTHGRYRRWKSLAVAFRESRKKDEVQTLAKRLERLQNLLGLCLHSILSDKQSDIVKEVEKLRWECRQFAWDRATQVQNMHSDLLHHVQRILPGAELAVTDVRSVCEAIKQMQSVNGADINLLSGRLQTLAQSLNNFMNNEKDARKEIKFLQSLAFPRMRQRREDIEATFAKTFQWILDPRSMVAENPIYFVDWLQNKSDLYWISGKAGSGKSTLMKFVSDNPTTKSLLQTWAGSQKLVIARYFFWSTGSQLERTQEGLLRSLLFDILLSCRERIHELHTALSIFANSGWTREDLIKSIKLVTDDATSKAKFCFFIDGLDEYGAEETGSLIKVIEAFSQIPCIKVCVSSRPWNEFSEAFGHNPLFYVRLETLTRGDIQEYVQKTFEEDQKYQMVKARSPRYPQLITEIVDRADGVFLWVHLVTQSLIKGLTNADRIEDLERRLRLLPRSLEGYFQRMLESVEDVYKAQTMSTLQIALEADRPLGLMTFSFLDEDKDFALCAVKAPMHEAEVVLRQDEMTKRINGRTRGILEIRRQVNSAGGLPLPIFDQYHVDFIHRTAHDFLRKSTDLHRLLGTPEHTEADNDVRVMYALLAQLKSSPKSDRDGGWYLRNAHNIFQDITYYASKASMSTAASRTDVEAAIEVVCDELVRTAPFALETRDILLCDVAAAGLVPYMRRELRSASFLAVAGKSSLLSYALQLGRERDSMRRTLEINVDMVRLLLEAGANPNDWFDIAVIWISFLRKLKDGRLLVTHEDDAISLVQVLVEYGAELDTRKWCISARDVIRQRLPSDIADSLLAEACADDSIARRRVADSNTKLGHQYDLVAELARDHSWSLSSLDVQQSWWEWIKTFVRPREGTGWI